MGRLAVVLSLLAVLSGKPLRQAEAASDFARALSHLLDPAEAIEIPDGGVGDDSGVAMLKAGTSHAIAVAWTPAGDPRGTFGSLPRSFILAQSPLDLVAFRRQTEEAIWLPLGACERHAWLQSFLF